LSNTHGKAPGSEGRFFLLGIQVSKLLPFMMRCNPMQIMISKSSDGKISMAGTVIIIRLFEVHEWRMIDLKQQSWVWLYVF
jgi:hypothetical protein